MRFYPGLIFLLLTSTPISILHAQDSLYAREIIHELTQEKYHGRGYVKKGDQKAAKYISGQFKKSGLLPLNSKSYFQNFSFPVNTFPGCMDVSINNKLLIPGQDFIADPGTSTCKGTYPVKRITKSPWLYPADELRGKWLLIDTTIAGNEITPGDCRKLTETPSGGEGIIFIAAKKLTWSVSQDINQVPLITILKSSLPEDVNAIEVNICSKHIPSYKTANVIGMIEGNTQKDSLIFITAHYDHLGRMGSSAYFPGANDNSSGIAMLLNLAKHFSQEKNRQPYTLVFVAFAGEEAGLVGSKYYTENPILPLSNIRFLLNLDLMGTGDEGMMVVNATEFPSSFQTLDSINTIHGYLPKLGQRGKAANSDHYWFTEAGVPGFFCYTLGGVTFYHDIYDRAETLPLTKFKEVFLLFDAFLRTL
jgi:aminopeptidase YwaD